MSIAMRDHWIVVLVGACLLFTGCGGGGKPQARVFAVNGKLTKGGQPLAGVRINFVPVDPTLPTSMAVAEASGEFVLKCLDGRDGAVAGKHKVVLEVVRGPEDYGSKTAPVIPFPQSFMTAATSPQEVEVKDSSETIVIDVH